VQNIDTQKKEIGYLYKRIAKVFVKYKNGTISVGTGFFVSENGLLITCWHVIAGGLLRDIKNTDDYKDIINTTESEKIKKYLENHIQKIEIEEHDGTKNKVNLKDYDFVHDLAILKTMKSSGKKLFFEIDVTSKLDYLDDALFVGFPEAPYYTHDSYPFAINTCVVSAFPEVIIGGKKYTHVQLNGVNLGGNSGAPLLKRGDSKVFGIINGNFIKQHNSLVVLKDASDLNAGFVKGNFAVPLGITYSTPTSLLSNESATFRKLVKKVKGS